VSILCAGEKAASEEERERMEDGLEALERPKVSMVERRTALFRRPAQTFFVLVPLFMLGKRKIFAVQQVELLYTTTFDRKERGIVTESEYGRSVSLSSICQAAASRQVMK